MEAREPTGDKPEARQLAGESHFLNTRIQAMEAALQPGAPIFQPPPYAMSLGSYNSGTAVDAQANREYRLRCATLFRRSKSPETRRWVIQKLKEHWSPSAT
ncbi:MAG: hypothetical protein NDJ89_19155, partial [Oligoflexia bacterium]|nr:hypothetical protein [Oligoflexia bacterium]